MPHIFPRLDEPRYSDTEQSPLLGHSLPQGFGCSSLSYRGRHPGDALGQRRLTRANIYQALPIRRWGTTPYPFLRGPSQQPWEVGAFIIYPHLTGEETEAQSSGSRGPGPQGAQVLLFLVLMA